MANWGYYNSVEASLIDYLTTSLSGYTDIAGNSVSIYSAGRDKSDWNLPVITVDATSFNIQRFEIGSVQKIDAPVIIIDIYNLTKFDRLILAKLVTDYVNSGWPYYDYSDTVDNPDSPTKVANGRIRVQSFLENDKVILGQNIDKFDKFRHRISLSVEKTGSGS